MLMDHAEGGYRFIPGSRFAAHAVLAADGMSIERAVFSAPIAWPEGFDAVKDQLARWNRPIEAICGIEIRMPAPLEFEDFRTLNDGYLAQLDSWGVLRDGESPFARTNVAPSHSSLTGPSIAAFSFTVEGASSVVPTFLLSGAAEVPLGAPYPEGVVRRGETSPDAMLEKARTVAGLVDGHMRDLGVSWDPSVDVHLYAAHDIAFATAREVLTEIGAVPQQGVIWHDAAPPTVDITLEIDLRRYARQHLIEY